MKILVTGSSGYLGSSLVRRLRRNTQQHLVVGLDLIPSSSSPNSSSPLNSASNTNNNKTTNNRRTRTNSTTTNNNNNNNNKQTSTSLLPTTTRVGSISDPEFVHSIFEEFGGFDIIFHTATLHQPHLKTHSRLEFTETNVQGTLHLLEEAMLPSSSSNRTTTKCFIYTSTTSLMISKELREALQGTRSQWVSEDSLPTPSPRNIYGVSKLAAEHLVRMYHEMSGIPALILRTSRFFQDVDTEPSPYEVQGISEVNRKLNEFLYRRVSLEDALEAHLLAMEKGPVIGFDVFIITASSPFQEEDCEDLGEAGGVARLLDRELGYVSIPGTGIGMGTNGWCSGNWREAYERLGFQMSYSFDRVYSNQKAVKKLGFKPRWSFMGVLEDLLIKQAKGEPLTIKP